MHRCVRALLAVSFVAAALPASPCSICRCGDPTFNALGKEGYVAQGLRLALDWERFDKQEGDPALEAEELIEQRVTALVSYGVSERLALYARVPLSFRDFSTTEEGEPGEAFTTRGLSDPEIYGQFRIAWSSFQPSVGRRSSLSLLGGVKTALGQNDYEREGERVDEHAQPGTGSTDAFGGLAGLHLIDARSALFASLQYRHTGTNDFGYRYGRVFLANLAYERKLAARLDGVVELNFRHAGADASDGSGVENTGGSVLYLTPRVLVDLGANVVLRAAAQIPVARSLNGVQEERSVLNAGLSFRFGR